MNFNNFLSKNQNLVIATLLLATTYVLYSNGFLEETYYNIQGLIMGDVGKEGLSANQRRQFLYRLRRAQYNKSRLENYMRQVN